mmetsp:Transcript_56848/g.165026  ORF Transcript_56848/g.165026 Transcript_56848/m.165026 type:complete len:286 (+) Transcript_56848:612-1469(+)
MSSLQQLRLGGLQQTALDQWRVAHKAQSRREGLQAKEEAKHDPSVQRVPRLPLFLRRPPRARATDHAQVVGSALQHEASGHDLPEPTDPIQRIEGQQKVHCVLQRTANRLELARDQSDALVAFPVQVPGTVPEHEEKQGAHAHQTRGAHQGCTEGRPPLHGDPQCHRDLVWSNARLLVVLARMRGQIAQVQLERPRGAVGQPLVCGALQALPKDLERPLRPEEIPVLPLDMAQAVILGDVADEGVVSDGVSCGEADGFRRLFSDAKVWQVLGAEHLTPRVHHEPC